MLANLLEGPLEGLLLEEPLEGLPAEQEEPSMDQMLVLEGRGVHLPQQAELVALPLEAFLEEVLAYQVVLQAYPEEPVASLVEQAAFLEEPVASLVHP